MRSSVHTRWQRARGWDALRPVCGEGHPGCFKLIFCMFMLVFGFLVCATTSGRDLPPLEVAP